MATSEGSRIPKSVDLWLVLAALLVVSACEEQRATSPAPRSPAAGTGSASGPTTGEPASSASAPSPASSATANTSGTPRERLMRSHFREVAAIRAAVIDGKLADAIAPADALAKSEGLGKIDPAWQSSIDVLEYAARRIQHGSDIPAVSAAVADIGIACGACHRAAGGPTAKTDTPPAVDASLESRMRRHVWAADRLWEGIYVPSDASWKAGSDALSGEPFPREVVERGGVHSRSAAGQFKTIVSTLATKKTAQDRGQAYASLLETCSACHVTTRTPKK